MKRLFTWGDIRESQYLAEKDSAARELQALLPTDEKSAVLGRLAGFLRSVVGAWKETNQDQRNRMARHLFEEIWVRDKQVIAVKPRPELGPFFRLSYQDWLAECESEQSTPLGVTSHSSGVTLAAQSKESFKFFSGLDCDHPAATI